MVQVCPPALIYDKISTLLFVISTTLLVIMAYAKNEYDGLYVPIGANCAMSMCCLVVMVTLCLYNKKGISWFLLILMTLINLALVIYVAKMVADQLKNNDVDQEEDQ